MTRLRDVLSQLQKAFSDVDGYEVRERPDAESDPTVKIVDIVPGDCTALNVLIQIAKEKGYVIVAKKEAEKTTTEQISDVLKADRLDNLYEDMSTMYLSIGSPIKNLRYVWYISEESVKDIAKFYGLKIVSDYIDSERSLPTKYLDDGGQHYHFGEYLIIDYCTGEILGSNNEDNMTQEWQRLERLNNLGSCSIFR